MILHNYPPISLLRVDIAMERAVALFCCLVVLPAAVWAAEHVDLPPADAVTPQLYATGFEIAEGPVLDADGNLYVANYRGNGNIGLIEADGTAGIFCNLGELSPVEELEPRANGMKLDRQGRLIVADCTAGRLLRVATDGQSVEVLADRWEGKRFDRLYDVALDVQGNIYFSDPGDSTAEEPTGSVYRYDITTAKVSRIASALAFPNGLGVTPDGKQFCLCESARRRLLIWDLAEDGTLSNGRVLLEFPTEDEGPIRGGEFLPAGMIFDAAGRLYVAMWDGGAVNVVDVRSGKIIRQYDAGGEEAGNCHFHGGYLYVTVASKEAVFRLKLDVEGFVYNATEEP